jgi:copper(I)-binding protein
MQNGNDMVKMKDIRDFRIVAANTKEVAPGNPHRKVTDLPQSALTCEVSSTFTSPGLHRRQFRR